MQGQVSMVGRKARGTGMVGVEGNAMRKLEAKERTHTRGGEILEQRENQQWKAL